VLVVDAIDGFWLVALDICDPTQPIVMARQSLVGRAARCEIEDDLVYVAASSGLWIYRLGRATTDTQVLDWHDPLCIGWKQRYTLSFSNSGDITLTGVRMVNTLPDASLDVLLGESSPGAVYDGDSLVAWEIGEVAPGEMVTRNLEIRLWSSVPAGTVLTDCLAVSSDQLSTQTACAQTLVVDCPQVTPTSTPSPVFTVTATPTLGPTNTPTRDPSPTRYAMHLPLLVK
jgi:hypothetical protein